MSLKVTKLSIQPHLPVTNELIKICPFVYAPLSLYPLDDGTHNFSYLEVPLIDWGLGKMADIFQMPIAN